MNILAIARRALKTTDWKAYWSRVDARVAEINEAYRQSRICKYP